MKSTIIKKTVIASLCVLAISGSGAAYAAGSTAQYIDDAAITTKVKTALIGDKNLKALQISVTTDQGTVQLSGNVDTKNQELAAVQDAKKVKGVVSVNDLLQVSGSQDQ